MKVKTQARQDPQRSLGHDHQRQAGGVLGG